MSSTLLAPPDAAGAPASAPSAPASGAATPWWGRAWIPVAVVLGLAVVFITRASFVTSQGRTFTLFDDAMVSMRFARNLAEGHGLVYNAGEQPVEGYTNFLWTLWMAALHLLPVPTRFVPLLVSASGAVLLAVGIVLVGAIARRLAPATPAVAAIAMWATALYYPLIFWTLRGLEPGLLAVLLQAAVLLAWRLRDAPSLRIAAALAGVLIAGVLTRTDFVVLAGVVVLWLAVSVSRPARRLVFGMGAAVVGAIAAHMLFELVYYGEALPNTYSLKLGGVGMSTRLARGSAGLGELVLAELAFVLALSTVALSAPRVPRVPRARVALLAGLVVTGAAYSVVVGGDAWEYLQYANRFLTPVVPLLFVLAAFGCCEIVRWPRVQARAALLVLSIVALVATIGAAALGPSADNLRNLSNLDRLRRSHWLALVGALALLLVCLLLLERDRASLAVGALAAALVLLVSLPAWTEWERDAGHLVRQNEHETRLGLNLGAAARGEPSIAVVAGGTIPYWSTLAAVDLLGKSDAVIASGPNRGPGFVPGHTKWDYRYSVCTLRPTLVVQLFEPTKVEQRLISGCGYEQVWDDVYVRKPQSGFDRQELARIVFETP